MEHASNTYLRRLVTAVMTLPLVLVLLLSVSVGSAEAATRTLYKQSFKGTVLSGNAYSYDGCVETGTYLTASKTVVSYSTYSYDYCTGEGSGVYGEAAPSSFQVRGDLSSGHVVATIPLTDAYTGESAGEIFVDEAFTATGPATKSSTIYRYDAPGYRSTYREFGTARPASASGTITLDQATITKVSRANMEIVTS